MDATDHQFLSSNVDDDQLEKVPGPVWSNEQVARRILSQFRPGDGVREGLVDVLVTNAAAIFTISASRSLPESDSRCLRSSSAAPSVLPTTTVFALQFLRRYLKVDAVVVASGGPSGRATPRTPLWRTQHTAAHGWLTPIEFVEAWLHRQQLQLA